MNKRKQRRTFSKERISEEMRETTRGLLAMVWRWRSSSKSRERSSAIIRVLMEGEMEGREWGNWKEGRKKMKEVEKGWISGQRIAYCVIFGMEIGRTNEGFREPRFWIRLEGSGFYSTIYDLFSFSSFSSFLNFFSLISICISYFMFK